MPCLYSRQAADGLQPYAIFETRQTLFDSWQTKKAVQQNKQPAFVSLIIPGCGPHQQMTKIKNDTRRTFTDNRPGLDDLEKMAS
jgi:hypothetical protein